ncbi:MAG: polysaccharide biosynthesis tyrosine autokinase [Candidatus Dormibacteraeota bacterium]|nr:polysaccharide biosynthesis tyrosine autokinase [Candidatus Dormibacteraeota bacterium]
MELERYWRVARRWLWLTIVLGLIAAITAGVVSYQQPKVYRATAVALVNPTQAILPNSTGVLTTDELVATYVHLLAQTPVRDQLVRFGNLGGDQAGSVVVTALVEPGTTVVDINLDAADPQVALAAARAIIPAFNGSLDELQQEVQGASGATKLQALVPVRLPTAVPSNPVRPQPVRDAVIALVAGMVLGTGIGFLLERLDSTIKSEADVRALLDLPLLGAVAFKAVRGGRAGAAEEVALVTVREPDDAVSEAFRAIRTNLLFSTVDRPLRSIVVTSTIPGEGKTSTACNIAVAMAQAGSRVILVDADFRRPALHRIFKFDNLGLGNLILGDRLEEEVIRATGIRNLRVVCSGPTPPNPSELLGSAGMRRANERLLELADVVIYDTPPVGAVTDASVLGARADGVILVVERGRPPVQKIQKVRDTLNSVGASILGAVLNKLLDDEAGYYSEYYNRSSSAGKRSTRKRPKPAGSAPL